MTADGLLLGAFVFFCGMASGIVAAGAILLSELGRAEADGEPDDSLLHGDWPHRPEA